MFLLRWAIINFSCEHPESCEILQSIDMSTFILIGKKKSFWNINNMKVIKDYEDQKMYWSNYFKVAFWKENNLTIPIVIYKTFEKIC